MYCRKCGKEISDDSLFCPSCGEKVNLSDIDTGKRKLEESIEEDEINSSYEEDDIDASDEEDDEDLEYDIEEEKEILIIFKATKYAVVILTLLGLFTFKILLFIATGLSVITFGYHFKLCNEALEKLSPSSRPKFIQNRSFFLVLSVIGFVCSVIKLYISR